MDERRGDPSCLVLGTAQLGMPYGIANRKGKPDAAMAESIVRTAWECGISRFDTAQAYGDSEMVLGRAFRSLGIVDEVRVITKLDPRKPCEDEQALRRSVEGSLKRLGVPVLHGLLLHREEMLDTLEGVSSGSLKGLLQDGLVRRLGVSVYSPERAWQALGLNAMDIIQIPASILDRRFQKAGIFKAADDLGRQIYIRSAFLQGLVLVDADHVPAGMDAVKPVLKRLETISRRYRLSRQAMALLYLRDAHSGASVIFGAEEPGQVRQNFRCWQKETPAGFLEEVAEAFPGLDEAVLNPSKWKH
jgi:aryl-alcohol dehydrogenase-like predicted oxidoreductase